MGRGRALTLAAAKGAVSGLAAVAVMTATERLEMAVAPRAESFVPGRALRTLLGGHPGDGFRSVSWNHAMHWGTGALVGALRGVWAVVGIRGTTANLHHAAVRLAFDQTIENATGVGAPPTSWPSREFATDLAQKTIYSIATGIIADRWIRPALVSERGRTSH